MRQARFPGVQRFSAIRKVFILLLRYHFSKWEDSDNAAKES